MCERSQRHSGKDTGGTAVLERPERDSGLAALSAPGVQRAQIPSRAGAEGRGRIERENPKPTPDADNADIIDAVFRVVDLGDAALPARPDEAPKPAVPPKLAAPARAAQSSAAATQRPSTPRTVTPPLRPSQQDRPASSASPRQEPVSPRPRAGAPAAAPELKPKAPLARKPEIERRPIDEVFAKARREVAAGWPSFQQGASREKAAKLGKRHFWEAACASLGLRCPDVWDDAAKRELCKGIRQKIPRGINVELPGFMLEYDTEAKPAERAQETVVREVRAPASPQTPSSPAEEGPATVEEEKPVIQKRPLQEVLKEARDKERNHWFEYQKPGISMEAAKRAGEGHYIRLLSVALGMTDPGGVVGEERATQLRKIKMHMTPALLGTAPEFIRNAASMATKKGKGKH